MIAEQQSKQWDQIVAKAWADEGFKKRLLAEPAAVLKEHDLEVPPGAQVKIIENTDRVLHLTLPLKPSPEELSEEDLDKVAGGMEICLGSPSGICKKEPSTCASGCVVVPDCTTTKPPKEYVPGTIRF